MENENNKPGKERKFKLEQPQPQSGQSKVPFSEALTEVIKNLKGQPLLLFVLGAAIVLVGAGVWGLESLRAITLPLLILLIVGLIAWGFLETRKVQKAGLAGRKVASGAVRIGSRVKAEEGTEVTTGGVTVSDDVAEARSGDVTLGPSTVLKGAKIKTGDVRVEEADAPDTAE